MDASKDLSTLAPGEITVLTGAAECGTTTLLETLAATPGTALLGAPPGEEWERDDVVEEGLGPAHLVGREMGSMSSGERQRVRLARFLASAPDATVLLLDEPFAYLDARGISEALATLRGSGKGVALVCKLDERVHQAADHLLTVVDGQVVGPTDEGAS